MLNEQVGRNLKKIRLLNDLSQDAVEIALNLSHGTYSKIENGVGVIDLDRLEDFAKFYKTDIYSILKFSDTETYKSAPSPKLVQEPSDNEYSFKDVELVRKEEKLVALQMKLELLKKDIEQKESIIKDKETIIELLTK